MNDSLTTSMHWDTVRPLLLKAFAKHGARDFIRKSIGFDLFMKETADSQNSLASSRAIQGHPGGVPIDPELMGCIRIPYNSKKFIFHKGLFLFSSQSILENGLLPGGHGCDKGRQIVFFTPLNFFFEESRDDYIVPQKVHYHSHWKRSQDAVHWIKLSRAQDQGLQVWQTKSHAIIGADCICKVISQNGDRILFERLSTPRPAPKVTLKSNWQSRQQQQQQQSICDDVTSTRRLVRETSGVAQRMIKLVQGDLYEILSQLLRKKPQFDIDLRVAGVSQDVYLTI